VGGGGSSSSTLDTAGAQGGATSDAEDEVDDTAPLERSVEQHAGCVLIYTAASHGCKTIHTSERLK
jgi:hypothetical protein